MGSQLGFVIKQ